MSDTGDKKKFEGVFNEICNNRDAMKEIIDNLPEDKRTELNETLKDVAGYKELKSKIANKLLTAPIASTVVSDVIASATPKTGGKRRTKRRRTKGRRTKRRRSNKRRN